MMRIGIHEVAEDRRQTGILLVHGITGSPAEMKPLVRKLTAEGFEVACPPLAGHCSSLTELKQTRWTDWYKSLETALDDLRTRCDKIFVSGLSMGALLALELAADHPDVICGVATLSATFFYDGWNVPRLRQKYLLPLVIYSPLRFFLSYHEPSPYGIKDDRIRTMIDAVYRGQCEGLPETYGYSEFPGVTIRETFRLIAAAKRDQSIRDYVWEAVEARLKHDLADELSAAALVALNERADPVLADLWDNPKDAAYDKL